MLTLVSHAATRDELRELWLAARPGSAVADASDGADALLRAASGRVTLVAIEAGLAQPLDPFLRQIRRAAPRATVLIDRHPTTGRRLPLPAQLARWLAGPED